MSPSSIARSDLSKYFDHNKRKERDHMLFDTPLLSRKEKKNVRRFKESNVNSNFEDSFGYHTSRPVPGYVPREQKYYMLLYIRQAAHSAPSQNYDIFGLSTQLYHIWGVSTTTTNLNGQNRSRNDEENVSCHAEITTC